ncbi:molecular chaperone [Enterobacteriaceae bacterium YMB-R22]|jgi:chaperone protein PapD|uniref:fimbrial biogenesis chaperone n=1 Tax=Tenebrionicola larvae TaxID=2815733 RepID=UPI00201176F2|nr:molecular chaperone [Tenebrionicola larvae]MBV4414029.1 molecular chaperone [Tenebrionicola larvae]
MSIRNIQRCGIAAFVFSMLSGYAHAGIALDRTRLIITEKDTSASVNLTNTTPDVPFLAQSWVEDSSGKKITSPLVILPPLQRIDGGQKGIARVTKTSGIASLPTDRESIFYLNVREIPPKADKPNVLQLAMQTRIKLFYRPLAVIPKSRSAVWQDQVVFEKRGSSVTAQNPTPYYITILGLTNMSGKKLTDFPGVMIAPKSSLDFRISDSSVNEFKMMFVNDYGGHPELTYRCSGNTCKALPQA